jgi:5'-nucleotidase
MTQPAVTSPKTSTQSSGTQTKTSSDNTGTANEATVKTPELPTGSDELAKKAPAVTDNRNAPATSGNMENTAKPTDTGTQPAMSGEEQSATKETRHVIVKGDTYWDLAKKYYGDGEAWKKIRDANDMRPRFLHIGAELTVPAK